MRPELTDLVQLFEKSDLTELRMEQGDRRLFLRKGEGVVVEPPPDVEEPAAPAVEAPLKAHMVGIFFWAKDKAPEPVMVVGQRVEKGQVIGFIEAMDLMNEVEAAQAGSILAVAASNGQAVEYGQPLVVIQPD